MPNLWFAGVIGADYSLKQLNVMLVEAMSKPNEFAYIVERSGQYKTSCSLARCVRVVLVLKRAAGIHGTTPVGDSMGKLIASTLSDVLFNLSTGQCWESCWNYYLWQFPVHCL